MTPQENAQMAVKSRRSVDPIRVVFYIPCLELGGAEKQLLNLVTRLDSSSFHPIVWCSGDLGSIADRLRQSGVQVHSLKIAASDPMSIVGAVQWLRGLSADVFHSFGYGVHFVDILAAKLAGIPRCFTNRGDIRYWDKTGEASGWEHFCNAFTDIVIVKARAIEEVCKRCEGLPPEKIRLVYNGVEIPEPGARTDLRQSLGIPDDSLLVGTVGNLRSVKGHAVLLQSFQAVKRDVSKAKLIICGEGPERVLLERLREELGLESDVFLVGSVQDTDKIYRGLDVFVQSSLSEGLSNSLLEAMAYGVPVVATQVGGTTECVEDGVSGILVPSGDPFALATALISILSDESLRREIGSAGRQNVIKHFSVSRMVDDYTALYRQYTRQAANSGPDEVSQHAHGSA